jgi:sulfate/thiosulfate-binding protein
MIKMENLFMKKLLYLGIAAVFLTAVGSSFADEKAVRKLFVVGFAVPGEAVEQEIAPAFTKEWAKSHPNEQVEFQFSWGGSSVQARNVISGLEADVVYLSDWTDVQKVQEAGLIQHDWNADNGGIVSKSLVVFRVALGNPLGIKDWDDLLKPGSKVLTPNPQTSGSARWNILALYGTLLRKTNSADKAEEALRELYRNVVTLGESGRATTQDFERGVGDIAITYENEILLFKKQGKEVEFVIPSSTIVIENAAAVVDTYANQHGNKDLADGFLEFLRSNEAQQILSRWGFRSIDSKITAENAKDFPVPQDEFSIADLGGWPKAQTEIFGAEGVWEKIIQTERKS